MNVVRIAPSILSADFARLGDEIAMLEEGGADWVHVDVMDGRFVPNITYGAKVIETVRRVSELPMDVHLMVVEPEKYFEDFVDAGASGLTVHAEVSPHLQRQLTRSPNPYADLSGNGWESRAEIVTDQLFAKWIPSPYVEATLGRQPISLATNYYFTPNDLFGPFAPGDFLRIYKEGEDALRLTGSLTPLTQVELIAVAGYERVYASPGTDAATLSEERFAPEFDRRQAALLGHLRATAGPMGIGTLFGWDGARNLAGFSLMDDLGSSWMLGFEGNLSRYDDDPGRDWPDASIGISRQLDAQLTARAEFASSPSAPLCPYCATPPQREQRSLNALGLDWSSSGLWQGGFVNLSDLDRWEGLFSWNLQRSLSDEADLILSGGIPWRLPKDRPETATVFELAPLSLNVQIRWVL